MLVRSGNGQDSRYLGRIRLNRPGVLSIAGEETYAKCRNRWRTSRERQRQIPESGSLINKQSQQLLGYK